MEMPPSTPEDYFEGSNLGCRGRMKKPRHNPQHPTIELVKDSYQPTKSELEEDMRVEATSRSWPVHWSAREYQMDRPATEPALMLRFRHFRI